ncbi:MFS transporter [Paenibacillus sp. N3.4]|uniref:MFS transporter n=1 Tax=Paenibacillus sp. N3.4 TaxID=2603222 RepID=UPI0011C9CE28|nr:MFS transporter [Paenibacillus sp. N3.4]TXK75925.1 MFS transporter [Paenibacillus sp. N3.4]
MNQSAVISKQASSMALSILFAVSFVHLLNDAIQSVIPSMFPLLQETMHLTFGQIGMIGFVLNITASLLQPLIGLYTDKKPMPYILPVGVLFSLVGVAGLAYAPNYAVLLLFVILIGIGSAVLHPESSRVAHLASGTRKGLAQSIFQLGGNTGQAIAPILTAFVFVQYGQKSMIWFTLFAALAVIVQFRVAQWYKKDLSQRAARAAVKPVVKRESHLKKGTIVLSMTILITLLFSKFVYLASMNGYYSFFLIDRFGFTIKQSQFYLFILLFAGMAGTFFGGPLADRFGKRNIIWFSILGTAPFSLLLPYASPTAAVFLLICIGVILMSGFSVIIVYAQQLLPGRVGLVAGLFFGLGFGLGGIGSAVLGAIADTTSVAFVIKLCAYLPLLGVLTILLPSDRTLQGEVK